MKAEEIPEILLPAVEEIGKIRKKGENLVVAVDGLCGTGKSTFAQILVDFFGVEQIRMDDFYLPIGGRRADWRRVAAGHMDLKRLVREVLVPIKEGKPFEYRPFDCRRQEIGKIILKTPGELTILEGSYSHHPALAPWVDQRVFMTCEEEVRLRRLKAREGERFAAFQETWMPLEERYIAKFEIGKTNSLTVDTTEL